MLDHALVDTFVMTADDDEMRFWRKFGCELLIETTSAGRHQNDFRLLSFELFDCSEDRLWFHDHPLPASERRVIDDAMFVGGPIAQVMNPKIDNLIFLRPLHHALAQRRAADFGKEREDVDLHVTKTQMNCRSRSPQRQLFWPLAETAAATEDITRRFRGWPVVRGAKPSCLASHGSREWFARCGQ